MKLNSGLTRFRLQPQTQAIVSVPGKPSARPVDPAETLRITPVPLIVQDGPDVRGERRFRATFSGETSIVY